MQDPTDLSLSSDFSQVPYKQLNDDQPGQEYEVSIQGHHYRLESEAHITPEKQAEFATLIQQIMTEYGKTIEAQKITLTHDCKLILGVQTGKIEKNIEEEGMVAEAQKLFKDSGVTSLSYIPAGAPSAKSSDIIGEKFMGGISKSMTSSEVRGVLHNSPLIEKNLLEKIIDFFMQYFGSEKEKVTLYKEDAIKSLDKGQFGLEKESGTYLLDQFASATFPIEENFPGYKVKEGQTNQEQLVSVDIQPGRYFTVNRSTLLEKDGHDFELKTNFFVSSDGNVQIASNLYFLEKKDATYLDAVLDRANQEPLLKPEEKAKVSSGYSEEHFIDYMDAERIICAPIDLHEVVQKDTPITEVTVNNVTYNIDAQTIKDLARSTTTLEKKDSTDSKVLIPLSGADAPSLYCQEIDTKLQEIGIDNSAARKEMVEEACLLLHQGHLAITGGSLAYMSLDVMQGLNDEGSGFMIDQNYDRHLTFTDDKHIISTVDFTYMVQDMATKKCIAVGKARHITDLNLTGDKKALMQFEKTQPLTPLDPPISLEEYKKNLEKEFEAGSRIVG